MKRTTEAPAKRPSTKKKALPEELPRDVHVRISNPDKPYWPEDGYAKLDLLRFYLEAFDRLRPYVRDRLLSLERCPDGMKGQCFFQKEKPQGMPAGTPTQKIQHVKGVTNYVVGGALETQLALANLGCIAVHVWGSRKQNPRKPDWICFDLDPDTGKFSDAAKAGLRVKEALDALDLISFAKTSGGKGMHVFVPIRTGPDCDEVLEFARRLGDTLTAAYSKDLTMESRIANRKGRVYLDPFRNGFGQTVVAPYSVRRKPRAPFSTPLAWSEVKPSLDPADFNLGNYRERLAKADPWKDFWNTRQSFAPAIRAVRKL
ncbi:MAG TPA: non-homologous end-joining DNA ligase [Thermoanaerobaculia bacterium]